MYGRNTLLSALRITVYTYDGRLELADLYTVSKKGAREQLWINRPEKYNARGVYIRSVTS